MPYYDVLFPSVAGSDFLAKSVTEPTGGGDNLCLFPRDDQEDPLLAQDEAIVTHKEEEFLPTFDRIEACAAVVTARIAHHRVRGLVLAASSDALQLLVAANAVHVSHLESLLLNEHLYKSTTSDGLDKAENRSSPHKVYGLGGGVNHKMNMNNRVINMKNALTPIIQWRRNENGISMLSGYVHAETPRKNPTIAPLNMALIMR